MSLYSVDVLRSKKSKRQIRAILKITDTALVGMGVTRPSRCLMQVGILRADDIRPYEPSFLIIINEQIQKLTKAALQM